MNTKLRLFDFDGTLFNSPVPKRDRVGNKLYGRLMSKSADGSGHGWFQDPITLSQRYTTDAGIGFIDEVVSEAKAAIADEDSITVLLTGRGEVFRDRVIELCESAGLYFDAYFLKPDQKETTGDFKLRVIDQLIDQHTPEFVEMWEDRPKHVAYFNAHLNKTGWPYAVHHVDRIESNLSHQDESDVVSYLVEKYPVANVSTRPNYYAVVLDDASQALLKTKYALPDGWVRRSHHMTIVVGNKFKVRHDLVEFCDANVSQDITLTVTGIAVNDKNMAISVASIPNVPTQNVVPHITIGHSPEAKPRDSNELIDWVEAEPFILIGKISSVY